MTLLYTKLINLFTFLLCFLLFAPSSSGQIKEPVLLDPKGPYPVGYKSFELKDAVRRDLYAPEFERTIPIEVWYPSEKTNKSPAKYLEDDVLLLSMIRKSYNHQDSAAITRMANFLISSKEDVQVLKGKNFPLLIFSHGLGVSKRNYTMLAERFASRGNIVVTIDHPYGGFTRTSDNRILTSRRDSILYSEKGDEALILRMEEWAEDIELVLNQILSRYNPIGREFYQSINSSKIVTMGHSLGGNVALQYPERDARVIAAVNLDGGTFGNLKKAPQVPTLTLRSQPIYSAEELKQKGRSVGEWETIEKEINQFFHEPMLGSLESYEIKIEGVGHMSFSDAPFVLPDMITRFGGELMNFEKAYEVIHRAMEEFLDAIFDCRRPQFDEVLIFCGSCDFLRYDEVKRN